ncbi:MAG: signal peptidase I, partial [Eubacteriales bacterium]|nr:signal peptidase I [Eubacteriales bacterium]
VIALLLPASLTKVMGFEVYNVISGSMEPALPEGSLVLVRPVESEDVEIGDIIAFDSNGSVVTHRVVANRTFEGKFVTKGDANEEEDINDTPYDQVIGRVEKHVPRLGAVMSMIASPLGKIYLFAFLLCGVLFNVLAGRLRE